VGHNRALAKLRVRVEHAIRRVKIFRIFSGRYRNRRKRLGLRLSLIAGLLNYELAHTSGFMWEVYCLRDVLEPSIAGDGYCADGEGNPPFYSIMGKEGTLTCFINKANINFTVNIFPFWGGTKGFNHFIKRYCIRRGVLKPGQKVKWLFGTQISTMMQSPRDRR
jgi:hypothetical protein